MELLAVIAILLVLTAITSSTLVRAKQSAGNSVELSNLRSLGQAAALYAEVSGHWPISASTLVREFNVPIALVQSPLDTSRNGFTNAMLEYHALTAQNLRQNITDYPLSYTGLGDLGYKSAYFESKVVSQPASGWLVSLVRCKPRTQGHYGSLSGMYHRLLIDTSVQRRFHAWSEGRLGRMDHPAFWFADGDQEWKEEISAP